MKVDLFLNAAGVVSNLNLNFLIRRINYTRRGKMQKQWKCKREGLVKGMDLNLKEKKVLAYMKLGQI